jgi:hypothetical protein
VAILGLAALPFAYDAYYQNRLTASPHHPVVEALEAEAMPGAQVIIGGDEASGAQGVFDDTYAFLQRRFDVSSVQTDWWYPGWEPRLARAVEGHAQSWLYAPIDSPLHPWLAERYPPLSSYELDGWLLSGWDTR